MSYIFDTLEHCIVKTHVDESQDKMRRQREQSQMRYHELVSNNVNSIMLSTSNCESLRAMAEPIGCTGLANVSVPAFKCNYKYESYYGALRRVMKESPYED